MKNIRIALKEMPVELADYLNLSFVEPIEKIGFVPDKYADVPDEVDACGLHILTFVLQDDLPGHMATKLRRIMINGHDDGNDSPFWAYESSKLTVIVPYSL